MKSHLRKLLRKYGWAQVAVWLGYKDTPPIKAWIRRGRIPPANHQLLEDLYKIHIQPLEK